MEPAESMEQNHVLEWDSGYAYVISMLLVHYIICTFVCVMLDIPARSFVCGFL